MRRQLDAIGPRYNRVAQALSARSGAGGSIIDGNFASFDVWMQVQGSGDHYVNDVDIRGYVAEVHLFEYDGLAANVAPDAWTRADSKIVRLGTSWDSDNDESDSLVCSGGLCNVYAEVDTGKLYVAVGSYSSEFQARVACILWGDIKTSADKTVT
jgi:hypothetical protein